MDHVFEVPARPTRATRRWLDRTYSWSVGLAAVSLVVGAWKVGIWVNHWYIAERVFYPNVDEAAKQGPYWDIAQLLRSGNEALRDGFIWLGVAALCVGVAVALRRRRRR